MGASDPTSGEFAGELRALKRRGCNLLVVGPAAGTALCGDLLGDGDRDRERLLVDAGHGPAPGTDASVVRAGPGEIRSASASSPAPEGPGATDAAGLDDVAGDLTGRIDGLEADGLEPGELRVCLGDLGTLDSDRSDDLAAFLETVTDRVREASGMGHAHLSDTSPLRAVVEPLFAITVEVRPSPEGRQQRWLLHEAGLDSGWVAIEE